MSTPYYADGGATVYHGDALAVLRGLPDASVDALVTDPPYSSGGMVRGDRMNDVHTKYVQTGSISHVDLATFSGDNRDQRAYGYWCALWLGECLRVTRPGGVAVLFTDWRQLPITSDALQAGGWIWRGIVPWSKPVARPMSGRFTAQCEYVVWGSAGPMPQDWTADTLPGFYVANAPREREHITQKPLDVMRSLVRVAPVGGVVLDPFAGGGTTGVAAVLEGRRFIGVEITEHYAALTARRLREARGQYVDRGTQTAIPEPEEAAS
jgi:site-specific DNA-methyltransferase (adenine-specific)